MPLREANDGNQGEGCQYQDGDDGADRPHIFDATEIDICEEDNDGGFKQIFFKSRQVQDRTQIGSGQHDI